MHDRSQHHTPHGEKANNKAPRVSSNGVEILAVTARQILDSRGNPTIAIKLRCGDESIVEASAPSGASTGAHEALERRDGLDAYGGKGVTEAVALTNDEIGTLLTSTVWETLAEVDDALRALDGTADLRRLGANSVVATSMAMARAFAAANYQQLHEWISSETGSEPLMPVPHFNVLNGGAHAANELAFQEFMIAPVGASSEQDAVQAGAEVYHALAARVHRGFSSAGLGDEGGFAPSINRAIQALDLLVAAIQDAGYSPALTDIAIALDPAANGFSLGNGRYRVDGRELSNEELADFYAELTRQYPIRSIEDGFAEDDLPGWQMLNERLGDHIQLVGDDLYVTDPARIRDGAEAGLSNGALIKPNQIGTVSQTFDAISVAKELGLSCMVSHRSGETSDTFIADLAVGTGVGQIKSGAPARGERTAKYNRLTEIELNSKFPFGLTPRHL